MNQLKRLYQSLPIVRELREIRDALWTLIGHASRQSLAQRETFVQRTLATCAKYADRRKLNRHEFQVFSQNGEDGIIAEIFRRIGVRSRVFVELGVGNGLENNTTFLLAQGWRGGWIEADAAAVASIRGEFSRALDSQQLSLINALVTIENVTSLIEQLRVPEEIDFLSVDIDRNTSHVWKVLKSFRPRVVAIEYNSTFPPDVVWEIDYQAERVWNRTAHFGASLKALELSGRERGYALVGCDFSGTNAFFVRTDENLSQFADPFTAENHHEPARYWTSLRSAHPRAYSG
jgi:hypothetical protein